MELASLIFSTLAFVFSVINLIELRAQKLSTHSVQYIDPWQEAMSEKSVTKINEDIKFDSPLVEEMPY